MAKMIARPASVKVFRKDDINLLNYQRYMIGLEVDKPVLI